MDDGKTYQEISEFLGCGYRTVAYWRVHGDPDNIESLHDERKKVTGQRSRDRIITGGKGGTVHLWNTSGQLLHNFQGALHKCGINWRLKPLKTRSKLSEIIP
ncbi:MAG: hypothetical protein KME55_06265 [Nostoc indistinguendum CM1-VF10]|jgi:hypothetical protein|nr:hypothetical protein [Nostoc indistinguendum CM1-VF10]